MKMLSCPQSKGMVQIMVFSVICTILLASQAVIVPGFLNIDCGNSSNGYEDSITGLTWERDDEYIQAGTIGVVQQSVDQIWDNYEALGSFRYFPKSSSKQCYHLPVWSNISLLIRAMFYHGGSPQLVLPITFQTYINATAWSFVSFSDDNSANDPYVPLVSEGIFFSPGNVTYFCLKPDQGSPFISSLEVRPLDSEGAMYSFPTSRQLLLSNVLRYNCVPVFPPDYVIPGNFSTSLRYPNDSYDRLWNALSVFHTLDGSLPANVTTSSEVNNVPLKVMVDASPWNSSLSDSAGRTVAFNPTIAPSYISAFFYFCNVLNNTNYSGGLVSTIVINSSPVALVNVTNHITLDYLNDVQDIMNGTVDVIGSVNAIEVYQEILFDSSHTNEEDGEIIDLLLNTFKIADSQGDPCTPFPYDWIECYQDVESYYVTSISLTNLSDSTRLLDIQPPTGCFSFLQELYIIDSNIDDRTFQFIVGHYFESMDSSQDGPQTIDMTNNNITILPPPNLWSFGIPPFSLNLSQNFFQGEIPTEFPFTPRVLNLSGNFLTSFPKSWGDPATLGSFVQAIQVLDLSDNNLAGDMSSLNELLAGSNIFFNELHIPNNEITGNFSSELYFSQLQILNLEGNRINGVLNLTPWHEMLKIVINSTQNFTSSNFRLFSFVNNEISDIYPSAEVLQPTIDFFINNASLLFNQSGVLMGGNPYCREPTSITQRYLCRSSTSEIIQPFELKKRNYLLLVSLPVGGSFFFILFCILFFSIWKLWTQVYSLRKIQQELADRKVHPPFYSYNDIKSATRNFHRDNQLGRGAYGAVYKGVLQDGTVVAVKRLFFNSQKQQVLKEFLNEMVLITELKHKNLVQLKGCCIKEETERIQVYEYAENGNVADALWGQQSGQMLDWKQRLNICVGVSRGLSYLHEELDSRIIHRDIKAANVLLDKDWNPKIADFGLAKPMLNDETRAQFTLLAGTRGYAAPEYLMEGYLTEKADVFSFGILVLEIMSGRKCIDNTVPENRLYVKTWAESLNEEGNLLELLQPELRHDCPEEEAIKVINIALACVQNDFKVRPKMSQVLTLLSGNTEIAGIANRTILREIQLERFLGDETRLTEALTEETFQSEESALLGSDRLNDDQQTTIYFTASLHNEGSSGHSV